MRKSLPALLIVVALIASAVFASHLPQTVAIHWDWRGAPDKTATKWVALLLGPALMVIVLGWLKLLPRLDPMRENIARFAAEYHLIVTAIIAFLLFMHLAILSAALGTDLPMIRAALIGIGVLFAVIGNVLPRLKRNHIAGFRTKATLADEAVWSRTHRFGGVIMVATGLLIVATAFAPAPWGMPIFVTLVLAMATTVSVYIRRVARRTSMPEGNR